MPDMTKVDIADVEVGDYLRLRETDWEGVVTAVDGDEISLRTSPWDEPQKVHAADVYWNSWDPKANG